MKQIRRTTWLAISLILCALFLGSSQIPAQATAPDSTRGITDIPPFNPGRGWGIITWDATWQGTIHLRGMYLCPRNLI